MTLDVTNLKKIYPGNGVNEEWTIDFPFFKAEHVRALHVSEVGIETELVQGTDFTVTGGDGGTGSLTFPIAGSAYPTLQATEKIAIFRDTPLLQELALRNFDEFNVRLIMKAMDLLTMQNQEHAEALDRAVKVSISDDTNPDELIATLLQRVQDAANAATASAAAQALADSARDLAQTYRDEAEEAARSVSLPIPISSGGTGETTQEAALAALGAEPADADILKRDVSAILTKGFPAAPAAMVTTGPTPATGALQTIDTSSGAVSLAAPSQAGVIRFIVTGGNALNPSASYDSINGEYDTGIGLAQGEIVSDGTHHFLTIINGVSA